MDSVVERRGSYDQGQPLLGDDSEAGSDEDKLGLGGEAKAEHHHHKSKFKKNRLKKRLLKKKEKKKLVKNK